MQYVALLRGINVGGNNIIKMLDLQACLQAAGFTDATTYIQSGNVLFSSPEINQASIVQKLEHALAQAFGYSAPLFLRSHTELQAIVHKRPKGFGGKPTLYRYDVVFLNAPLTVNEALSQISLKEGVDEIAGGTNVLYMSRLDSRATQSRLNRIASLPIYKHMTIRNWNTTTKLLTLMDARMQTAA